jgi:hypothetical protein
MDLYKKIFHSTVMSPHRTEFIAISFFDLDKYADTIKNPFRRFILRLKIL